MAPPTLLCYWIVPPISSKTLFINPEKNSGNRVLMTYWIQVCVCVYMQESASLRAGCVMVIKTVRTALMRKGVWRWRVSLPRFLALTTRLCVYLGSGSVTDMPTAPTDQMRVLTAVSNMDVIVKSKHSGSPCAHNSRWHDACSWSLVGVASAVFF